MTDVPATRIRKLNAAPIQQDSDFVLYWMIANRRAHWNYALDRAVELSRELNKPLVVCEALSCSYPWASDRLHRFVLQGMADNRAAFHETPIRYYPYVETERGGGRGLIEELAKDASVVVTDDFPCFFLPRMTASLADRLSVSMESVDSNGLLPMRAADKVFLRAHDYRRWLQRNLPPFLAQRPNPTPLAELKLPAATVPRRILKRWTEASVSRLEAGPDQLSDLPIDHSVSAASFDGGTSAAGKALDRFFRNHLARYADGRNQPDDETASGLSPYLHFGHLSSHEVFDRIVRREQWTESDLSDRVVGAREGWWGMSPEAEAFLDQLITWRELGYNMCSKRDDYDQFDSLPDWAQKTLDRHASDTREYIYQAEEFEAAATHDDLWNAAQTQLAREGRMHNYLRMLWGKKILEWSASPREALATMIHLNNKYAVDGRNPNSYSGIFWVLGRYDRAWGPERPIFGKVRYMSSENTAKKLRVREYLNRYSPDSTE